MNNNSQLENDIKSIILHIRGAIDQLDIFKQELDNILERKNRLEEIIENYRDCVYSQEIQLNNKLSTLKLLKSEN